ncbi:MAG TPA: glycosyltransferase [Phycisphaerae bacterium]|nr:glycosyltransferase [Phycisphaerae bacterium]
MDHVILAEDPPVWQPQTGGYPNVPAIPCWRRATRGSCADVLQKIIDHGPALVHYQYDPEFLPWPELRPMADALHAHGIGLIVTIHRLHDLTSPATCANKAVLEAADAVIVGTPHMDRAVREYVDRFHLPTRGRTRVIPLASPVFDTPPLPPRGGPTVLTFGFLGRHKGHAEVLDAVRILRVNGRPMARYEVMGAAITGEQRQVRDELAAVAAKEPDLVTLTETFAPCSDLERAFSRASVIALNHNTPYASSSGTVCLALASGRPVVVSDMPMLVSGNEGAVVVARAGPAGWADAIDRALRQDSTREDAQAAVRERIHPRRVAEEHLSLYRAVLSRGIIPDPLGKSIDPLPPPPPPPAPVPKPKPPVAKPAPPTPPAPEPAPAVPAPADTLTMACMRRAKAASAAGNILAACAWILAAADALDEEDKSR